MKCKKKSCLPKFWSKSHFCYSFQFLSSYHQPDTLLKYFIRLFF